MISRACGNPVKLIFLGKTWAIKCVKINRYQCPKDNLIRNKSNQTALGMNLF